MVLCNKIILTASTYAALISKFEIQIVPAPRAAVPTKRNCDSFHLIYCHYHYTPNHTGGTRGGTACAQRDGEPDRWHQRAHILPQSESQWGKAVLVQLPHLRRPEFIRRTVSVHALEWSPASNESVSARIRCGPVPGPIDTNQQKYVDACDMQFQLKIRSPLVVSPFVELFYNIVSLSLCSIPLVVMQIAPGEPVPPGFENEVKPVAELQRAIDNCKDMSLIGLEYVLELTPNSSADQPTYLCVLCETRDDPDDILLHVSSFVHRSKYLVSWLMAFHVQPNTRLTVSLGMGGVGETLSHIYPRVRCVAQQSECTHHVIGCISIAVRSHRG